MPISRPEKRTPSNSPSVLVLTTFFPNGRQPARAVFVKNLVTALLPHCDITVVAPIPCFPRGLAFGRRRVYTEIFPEEILDGIPVFHPRFPVIPGQTWLTGRLYAAALSPFLKNLMARRNYDLLHAHCAYPDGYAAYRLAGKFGIPLCITAHGSDINKYALKPVISRLIRKALTTADRVIAVSPPLRDAMIRMGIRPEKIARIPCAAADPALFNRGSQPECRRKAGVLPEDRMIVFVGELVPVKGVSFLIRAVRKLLDRNPSRRLVVRIVGEGPLAPRLKAERDRLGLSGVVRFIGAVPHGEVPDWIRAADLLCLPSLSEGTPNVVIEALMSGVPVVASQVGGIPHVVRDGVNGRLVPPGKAGALADALASALNTPWDEVQIQGTVRGYSWTEIAGRNFDLYREIVEEKTRNRS